MNYLDKYRKRTGIDKSYQENLREVQEDFEYFMRYAPNVYDATKWRNEEKFKVNVQDVSWSNKYGDEKYINVFNSTNIKIGDVVEIKDLCDRLWLITEETYKSVKSHRNFRVRPCTYILKYFLPNELDLIETPCIIDNATKYSTGVEETNRLATGNARRSIWLPRNRYTEQITHGMRFFTQHGVWITTALDYDTEPKLIILTCTEDEYDSRVDNKELKIANYYNRDLSLDILNLTNDKEIKLNEQFEIKYIVKNEGKITDRFNPTITSSDENIIKVKDNNLIPIKEGSCKIEIKLSNIIKTYSITVVDKNIVENKQIKIIGEDELKLQTYQKYSISEDINNVEWKVNSNFNNSIKIKDNYNKTCILYTDNKKDLYKTFTIELYINGKIVDSKEIEIVNII